MGFTLFTLVFWLFLLGRAVLGDSNYLWIPVGLVIVFLVIPLANTIAFNPTLLSDLPGSRFGGKMLSIFRNLIALITVFGLFYLVMTHLKSGRTDHLWEDTWNYLWRIISGQQYSKFTIFLQHEYISVIYQFLNNKGIEIRFDNLDILFQI